MCEAVRRSSNYLSGDDTKALVGQRLQDAKARMPEQEFDARYQASAWHGRKIEQVMRDVGMQSVYDLPFRLGSRAAHATDLFDHMHWSPETGFVLNLIPGDKWAEPVLGASNLLFLEILGEVNSLGNFAEDEEIRLLTEKVKATYASHRPEPGDAEPRDQSA
jgi:hypothetical protein